MRWSQSDLWRSRWLHWGSVLAVTTLLGACEAVHSYFSYAAQNDTIGWTQAFGMGLGLWYGWGVLWVGAYLLVKRLPLEQHNWLPRLLIHLGVGLALPFAKIVLDYPVILSFYCPNPKELTFPRFYGMGMRSQYYLYVLIGWAMLGIAHALRTYTKFWERTLLSAQLQARLARAQLQVLKMQLHPHFLFNTLNTISALIHSDTECADAMVARLGDLLRQTLEQSGGEEVPLRRELDIIESYLDIDRIRFGSRLDVTIDVEPEALSATLPCLLLQPLVENAIRHGLEPKVGTGHLSVRARRSGPWLRVQIEDDGVGLPANVDEGVGLSNTRARLRQLYGEDHAFVLQGSAATGTCVTVEVPFRSAEEVDGEKFADTAVNS